MVDWWAVGCILYEVMVGAFCFGGKTKDEVFKNIKNKKIQWPAIGTEEGQLHPAAKDLILKLLENNPNKRFGNNFEQIKKHRFFNGINWSNLNSIESPIEINPNKEIKKSGDRMFSLFQ